LDMVRTEVRATAEDDREAERRGVSKDEMKNTDEAEMRAFVSFLRHGERRMSPADRALLPRTTNPDPTAADFLTRSAERSSAESRTQLDANAITVDSSGASAGNFLVPQGFWHNLQIAMKAFGGIQDQFNLVETSTGNPMPWPTHDPTALVG